MFGVCKTVVWLRILLVSVCGLLFGSFLLGVVGFYSLWFGGGSGAVVCAVACWVGFSASFCFGLCWCIGGCVVGVVIWAFAARVLGLNCGFWVWWCMVAVGR